MYGCESWTIKKAECWRIDAFELRCWRRPLRVPWTAHPKGDQSWVFIGRTDAEAETPILWPPYAKNWFIGKVLDAGKDWRQEEKGTTEDEMASLTRWTWVWASSGSWWWTGKPGVLQSMGLQRVGYDWVTGLNYSPGIHSKPSSKLQIVLNPKHTMFFSITYTPMIKFNF